MAKDINLQQIKDFCEIKIKPLIDEIVDIMFDSCESGCKISNCQKPDSIPCGHEICIQENKEYWHKRIDELIENYEEE